MKFTCKPLDELASVLDAGPPEFFSLSAVSTLVKSDSARLALRASFLPCSIENGLIVKGDVFVGCTGAMFKVRAVDSILAEYTPTCYIEVNHHNQRTRSGEVSAGGTLPPASGNAKKGKAVSSDASFASQEGHLVATPRGSTFLSWSFFLHRGEKAVRDFLEGYLDLTAIYSWEPKVKPRVLVSARPSDRRFYSSTRRELGRLKSIALAAKLVARGVQLPKQRTQIFLIEGAYHD